MAPAKFLSIILCEQVSVYGNAEYYAQSFIEAGDSGLPVYLIRSSSRSIRFSYSPEKC
jgi:hypothetical protein